MREHDRHVPEQIRNSREQGGFQMNTFGNQSNRQSGGSSNGGSSNGQSGGSSNGGSRRPTSAPLNERHKDFHDQWKQKSNGGWFRRVLKQQY